jgi:WXXGXW repeat (2 copies)
MKVRYSVLFVLLCTVLGLPGCTEYYAGYPGYGPYYGPGPYYGGGSVVVAVGDRPYYRGPGYWSSGAYYIWKQGHWGWRHHQQVWIRGHYVVRGY